MREQTLTCLPKLSENARRRIVLLCQVPPTPPHLTGALAERKVLLHEQLTRVGQLLKDNALPDVRIDLDTILSVQKAGLDMLTPTTIVKVSTPYCFIPCLLASRKYAILFLKATQCVSLSALEGSIRRGRLISLIHHHPLKVYCQKNVQMSRSHQ